MSDNWLRHEIVSHDTLLKRYLRRCGLQPQDAEDICQQTYLRILETADRDPPRSAKALFFHIARNLVIDLRRSARHRWLKLTGNLEDLDRATALDPERHMIASEELESFVAAVEGLPPRRREAFLLRRVENVNLQAIARSMHITVPAVEQHLALALRSLRHLRAPR